MSWEKLRTYQPSPWLSVLIVLAVFAAVYGPFFLNLGPLAEALVKTDLASFFAASQATFNHHQSPYSPSLLQTLAPGRVWPFIYPPQSLLLFYPLSLLTYDEADIAVLYANQLCLVVLVFLVPFGLLRLSPQRHLISIIVIITLGATFWPVEWNIREGQVNLFLCLGLVLFWMSARSGRDVSAGFLLAVVICLKAYPALLLPMLWIVGRHRLVAYTIAGIFVISLLALFLLPWQAWTDWLFSIVPSGGYGKITEGLGGAAPLGNQTINGLFARAFTDQLDSINGHALIDPVWIAPTVGRVLAYIVSIALITITLRVTWRYGRNKTGDAISQVMFAGLPLIFLVAPISWTHHLTYMLPVLAAIPFATSSMGQTPSLPRAMFALAIYAFQDTEPLYPLQMFSVLFLWTYAMWSMKFVSRGDSHEEKRV